VRLFGTDDVEILEMLGHVTVDAQGNVLLAVGPFAGEKLSAVEWEGVNQQVIKSTPASPQSQGLELSEVKSAPCRTRTYNPLIKSQLLCQLS
jgi:hypothetical protein